jgi:UDP-N-acetylglucosamine acyltransferase
MENNAVNTDPASAAVLASPAGAAPGTSPAAAPVAPPVAPVPAAVEVAPAPSEARRRAWFKHLLKFRLFSGEQPKISPQAVVDEKAEIDESVEIGPFCVIGPHVKIGPGCKLLNNVTILGHTTIGRDNIFFPNAVIGAAPQDLKYRGAPTRLTIGDGNVFREAATVHVGTEKGGGVTRVGNSNLIMINVHLGHDVQLGNRCVISNNVMIAGHVIIDDNVSMMGLVGIHHFVTIGKFAYLGGAARIHHDVPPFVKVDGEDKVRALNTIGLKRAGFSDDDIACLKEAVRKIWFGRKKAFSQSLAEFALMNGINPHVKEMIEFLRRRDSGKHGRYLEGQRTA